MRNVSRVLRYLAPYWRLAVASAIITLLTSGVSLLLPWPLKILVDNVLSNQPPPPPWTGFSEWLGLTGCSSCCLRLWLE
jgi:ABC-type multidrug transport system fused ATPase/permease subunit